MLKKLDWYTTKTFLGPFIFIFSVLFFIFIIQFAWNELDKFIGKGLDGWTIFKLLIYLGINIIQMVLPLTILLASIMSFGGFGERYELAAMKSAGLSLARIMMPLFVLVSFMAVGLYYFSDRVLPSTQKKAKNMLYNIANSKPTLNFKEGMFISGISGMTMKIGEKSGKEGEFLKDVFIHINSPGYQDQKTIIAKNGKFAPTTDKRYLKLELFDGYYYQDYIAEKGQLDLLKQPNQTIKFDTLQQYFDISDIIEKAIEKENITDNYKFLTTKELISTADTLRKENDNVLAPMLKSSTENLLNDFDKIKTGKITLINPSPLWKLDDIDPVKRQAVIDNSIADIQNSLAQQDAQKDDINWRIKLYSRHILQLHRNFAYPVTCIVFFLIGAPLGAIIRKGGIGMPVVMAIIIFVLFYIITFTCEGMTKTGSQNPAIAAWMANFIFLPLGIFFTYKAMTDSAIYNADNYLKPFKKIIAKFGKTKTEHARYQ